MGSFMWSECFWVIVAFIVLLAANYFYVKWWNKRTGQDREPFDFFD